MLTYWKTRFEEAEVFESDPDQVIQTTRVAGEEWPNLKCIQILLGGKSDDPVISDVPEQLELQPTPLYNYLSDNQDLAQHDNDDSPNRLSTIPEEDSQASYLVGPEQGSPDEVEIDSEVWQQLDANVKICLLEHGNVKYHSAGKFDEYEGQGALNEPSDDTGPRAPSEAPCNFKHSSDEYGEPEVDENGNP